MKKSKQLIANSQSLTIGWLYPELMSTYGDKGNITVLKKRSEWRGIDIEIINIDQDTSDSEIASVNLLFGGGAQDREQALAMDDLFKKSKQIEKLIENNVPALFVCGSPQLFGKYYEPSIGKKIEGVGVFDMTSIHPGPSGDRLIGNVIAKCMLPGLDMDFIVGFENHGGRTHLGKNSKPLARIVKGYGNNGIDKTEGVVYKNALGSYLHGPLLPKNPLIADWLIKKALEVKYSKEITLKPLDDSLEEKARYSIAERLGVKL